MEDESSISDGRQGSWKIFKMVSVNSRVRVEGRIVGPIRFFGEPIRLLKMIDVYLSVLACLLGL